MRIRPSRILLLMAMLCATGAPASAQVPYLATLSLDSFSYLNFDAKTILEIPSGSQLRMSVGDFSSGGTATLRIEPADASIGEISTPAGSLTYALAQPATGSMHYESDGTLTMSFVAHLRATIDGPDGGSAIYVVTFTTSTASANSLVSQTRLEDYGVPVASGRRPYVRLVGAKTNAVDALVMPGAAVVGVLSGTFDQLPAAP